MIIDHRAVRPRWMFAMLLAVIGAAGASVPSYGIERVWTNRFPLPPGGRVSIENVHGALLVEGWDRAEVEATVAISSRGSSDRLDDVQVAVEKHGGSLAFHTIYPADLDTPIRVDYRLHVPREVRLDEISTLEGGIIVRGVEGVVKARSLHGGIAEVDVSGAVVARTLTGDISVSLRALPDSRSPVKIETINGNVNLLLPTEPNADLELSTVAGRILGNYAFQASSLPGDSTRRVRLGEGGVHIGLRTVRGNIRVGERSEDL
jgi:hypothetical protein